MVERHLFRKRPAGHLGSTQGPRQIDKWGTSADTEITARGGGSYQQRGGVRGMSSSIVGGAVRLPRRAYTHTTTMPRSTIRSRGCSE